MHRGIATAVLLVAGSSVFAAGASAQTVFSASGGNAAAIQPTVDAFRTALGTLNPNSAVPFANGRREINWDAVPDALSAPNSLPANFFNVNSPRGVVFTTPGTGFEVSATAASGTPVEFGNVDPSYTAQFQTFSPQRLFRAVSSTTTDVNFFIPGTSRAATTAAFGAVFTDVENASATTIALFDRNSQSLGTVGVPAGGNGALSFAGIRFASGRPIARVRITSGSAPLAAGGADADAVVMDDFIYGEPAPQFTDLALAQTGSPGSVAAGGRVTYTATVTNNGLDPVDGVTLRFELSGGSAAATPAGCMTAGQTVTCDLGRVANTGSATVELPVDAPAAGGGVISSNASVSSSASDTAPADNAVLTQTTVDPAATDPPVTDPPATDPPVTDPPGDGVADSRPPQVTITGVRAKLKRKKFLKGVTAQVGADEPSSFEIQLLGPAKKARRPKVPDVVLAEASLPLGADPRPVTLKPKKALVKKARKLTARVRVEATDPAGNRAVATQDIRVKR